MKNFVPVFPWIVVLALAVWRTLATGDPYWGVVGFLASSVVGLSGVHFLFSRTRTPPKVGWVYVTPRCAYGLDDPCLN